MEIKIKNKEDILKLQGGGVSPTLAYYIQVPNPQSPTQPSAIGNQSQQSGNQSDSLLDDKQAALIREHGLPSDVEAFFSMIKKFENNFTSGLFVGSASASTKMAQINAALNKVKYNKDRYDEALKDLAANGGMQEIAVTTTGRIVVVDNEGTIKQVTPSEYSNNRDKYSPLTNADIADLRANNSKYAFNTNIILSTLGNGTSMENIDKLVKDIVNNIGKNEVETSSYASKQGNKISQGLQELLSEDNADGVYKITRESSHQTEKAKYALNYIYSTLPENAKTLLKAKAVSMGMNADSGAYELITMMIQSRLNDKVSTKIEYDKQASASTSSGSGDSKAMTSLGPLDMFINGESTDVRNYQLNPGTQFSYVAPGTRVFNGLPNNDNKTLAPSYLTVTKALNDTALGSMGTKSSVSFGTELLSDTALDRVIVDSRSVAQVWLPYTQDAQGRIIPNYDTLFDIQVIEKEIQDAGTITEQEKMQKYKDKGLEDFYYVQKDPKYAYQKGLIRPFLAATGIAADNDVFGIDGDTNKAAERMPRDMRSAYIQLMYNVYLKENPNDDFDDIESWLPFGWNDNNIYKGTILIPISDDRMTAHALTGNINMPKSSFMADDMLKKAQSSVNGMSGLTRTNFMNNGEN